MNIREVPVSVMAATISAVVSGIALGAVVGPAGVAVGVALGVAVGVIAGRVMEDEDQKAIAHDRELDEIIGITQGRIGAAPLPPPVEDPADRPSRKALEEWAAEWLTPPPPMAGATPAPPGAR